MSGSMTLRRRRARVRAEVFKVLPVLLATLSFSAFVSASDGALSGFNTLTASTTAGLMVGNPILPYAAEKFQQEIDFTDGGPAPLYFVRYYRSNWGRDATRVLGPLGKAWSHNHGGRIEVTAQSALIYSPEGYVRGFTRASATAPWIPAYGRNDMAVVNGQKFAVHSDHLNTPRRVTNSQGQPVWQWAYSAFGDDSPTTAKNRFANLELTPNPGTSGIAEFEFNLRYDGQYNDRESGLYYNGQRSYCTNCGERYTQPDPIGLQGGWNRRGFDRNNALRYADPDGLLAQSLVPIGATVVLVGCTISEGCKKALVKIVESCVTPVTRLKDWLLSDGEEKSTAPGDILTSNGEPIGEKVGGAGAGVRTVPAGKLDEVEEGLKGLGAQQGSKPNYPGEWYDLPKGQGSFGVRDSRGSGKTLDINIPSVPDVTKIHQR